MYGEGAQSEAITRRFNGRDYTGMRVRVALAGTRIVQDVLSVPSPKGSRFLILQDFPAEEKVSEEEAETVLKLLDQTLEPSAERTTNPARPRS